MNSYPQKPVVARPKTVSQGGCSINRLLGSTLLPSPDARECRQAALRELPPWENVAGIVPGGNFNLSQSGFGLRAFFQIRDDLNPIGESPSGEGRDPSNDSRVQRGPVGLTVSTHKAKGAVWIS